MAQFTNTNNRRSYQSQMDRDYYTNPKQGFDKGWHHNQKLKAEAKARKELKQTRQKIKALRQEKASNRD